MVLYTRMSKIISFAIVLQLIALNSVQTTVVNSCNKNLLLPNTTISINSLVCSETPCTCIPGCPFKLHLEFDSPRYLEHFKPDIIATYAGIKLDYPLGQDDGCDGLLNTQCPIVENEPIKYEVTMNVLSFFPEVTVSLNFTLQDLDADEPVVCILFDINVKKMNCPA
ncbi:NPC intracellular cholesterol transporter 2-like [Rhynchophorus ferrugineus]|uniref:NPC intracellular cholesterol transporter 2-like n=1 Tax=Rhynchophorus ferrugineus TaxID=354439 RepID=UPI003FCC8974